MFPLVRVIGLLEHRGANMRPGVHITRDEQLTQLEQSVFNQIRSVLPVSEAKEKPPEFVIQEVDLESAIRELISMSKFSEDSHVQEP